LKVRNRHTDSPSHNSNSLSQSTKLQPNFLAMFYGCGQRKLNVEIRVVNIAILYWYWQVARYCQYCFQYCQSIAILFENKYWYWYWQYYYEYW